MASIFVWEGELGMVFAPMSLDERPFNTHAAALPVKLLRGEPDLNEHRESLLRLAQQWEGSCTMLMRAGLLQMSEVV